MTGRNRLVASFLKCLDADVWVAGEVKRDQSPQHLDFELGVKVDSHSEVLVELGHIAMDEVDSVHWEVELDREGEAVYRMHWKNVGRIHIVDSKASDLRSKCD